MGELRAASSRHPDGATQHKGRDAQDIHSVRGRVESKTAGGLSQPQDGHRGSGATAREMDIDAMGPEVDEDLEDAVNADAERDAKAAVRREESDRVSRSLLEALQAVRASAQLGAERRDASRSPRRKQTVKKDPAVKEGDAKGDAKSDAKDATKGPAEAYVGEPSKPSQPFP